MGAQFLTAAGAFLGTLIGIAVQEMGKSSGGSSGVAGLNAEVGQAGEGLWGTSLAAGDLLLPFTAGTFLYVGTVAVIPELLESATGAKGGKMGELRRALGQFVALAAGAGIML